MRYRLVLTCDDIRASGYSVRCCNHCHAGMLTPAWPPSKMGGLNIYGSIVAAVCCFGILSPYSRPDWAKIAWRVRIKRKERREALLGNLKEELMELVG